MRFLAPSTKSQDLDDLDWSESIKDMQRNWIGRSEGASVLFPIKGAEGASLEVFTTRPDTLFGATYMVVAPEHPMLSDLTTMSQKVAVTSYVADAASKSDMDRTSLSKEKTGVFTGA